MSAEAFNHASARNVVSPVCQYSGLTALCGWNSQKPQELVREGIADPVCLDFEKITIFG